MKTHYDVLDFGYLKYIEHWGSDERIIEAARMSTDKGFLGWEPGMCPICCGHKQVRRNKVDGKIHDRLTYNDEIVDCYACEGKGEIPGDLKLLRHLYLSKPQHSTPFEMAGCVIEVQAPIFVFREWHRHRTRSYNEMSARYTPLPNLNYIPTVDRLMINAREAAQSGNKQAGTIKGAEMLTEEQAEEYRTSLMVAYMADEDMYQKALGMGVPKELARIHLPVGRYSRMRDSANLLNCLRFLTLRAHKKAQWEIRQYAEAFLDLLNQLFPRTIALFEEDRPK